MSAERKRYVFYIEHYTKENNAVFQPHGLILQGRCKDFSEAIEIERSYAIYIVKGITSFRGDELQKKIDALKKEGDKHGYDIIIEGIIHDHYTYQFSGSGMLKLPWEKWK